MAGDEVACGRGSIEGSALLWRDSGRIGRMADMVAQTTATRFPLALPQLKRTEPQTGLPPGSHEHCASLKKTALNTTMPLNEQLVSDAWSDHMSLSNGAGHACACVARESSFVDLISPTPLRKVTDVL